MSCGEIQEQLSLYLYGELSGELEETVESHCAACVACGTALARERTMHAALDSAEEPVPALLLADCRRELGERLHVAGSAPVPGAPAGWFSRVREWLSAPAVWRPAAALGLLAVGFLSGRMSPQGARPSTEIAAESPVVATRVRNVNSVPGGAVQIQLEETRQRTVAGALNDEPIRRLLLAAAQEEADPALRVETVELLRGESDEAEVRRALMAALQRDSNPGVRLKALEGLKAYASDPEVRQTVSQALLRDENSGVRTLAVDVLMQQRHQDVVSVFQQLAEREDNTYIRQRTQKALREMNASVETF